MTEQEFASLRIGNVISPRPGDRYVVTEVRVDGAIAVKTSEVRDRAGWRVAHARHGRDVLERAGLSGLAPGDLISQEGGLTYLVTAVEPGAVTVLAQVKVWRHEDWALVG